VADTQASFDTLPVGYRLDDFRIVAVLGKGGFGITYRAVDERLARDVAIKEYLPREFAVRGNASVVLPRDGEAKQTFEWGLRRFVDEARALALFRHRNIVSVLRFLEANGTAYLVMEYEEGEDLERWLAHRSGVTEAELIQPIVMPILDGLEKVHAKQLLHRDIKPANIFIRSDGSPVLIDFGASRAHGAQATANVTTIVSAGYSPFEQYGAGTTRQGPWTDLYALAGTMYRAIAGAPPVDAIARMQGNALVPATEVGKGRYSPSVLAAIDRALALDASDRPQSVAEFRALLTANASEATRPSTSDQPTVVRGTVSVEPKRSSRGPTLIVGAVAALAAIVAGWWYLREGSTGPTEPTIAAAPAPQMQPDLGATPAPSPPAPDNSTGGQPEEARADPEDLILQGLDMPADVHNFRRSHIAGTLLAYIENKKQFDQCQQTGCPDLARLMQNVLGNQQADWKDPPGCQDQACQFAGTVTVTNPRHLDRADCPYLIDLTEVLRHVGTERKQIRTYCTGNGWDRVVDHAGPVT